MKETLMVDDGDLDKQKLCYNGNIKLKKAGVTLSYTPDQIQEYIKCKNDIIYFIKNYVKIISLDHGLVPFELYSYQEEMIGTFDSNRFTICLLPRQSGKCFLANTTITVRNKHTGEIQEVAIGEFFDKQKTKFVK